MRVTMLLADFAQTADGKLNIIGGGWSVAGPQPFAHAIALLFEIPWDQANDPVNFRIDLVDQDGEPVMVQTPEGEQPLYAGAQFEVGRPPGMKRGTPLNYPIAFNIGPQQFAPGGRYEWRLTVNGEQSDDWRLPFGVRAAGPATPGGFGTPAT